MKTKNKIITSSLVLSLVFTFGCGSDSPYKGYEKAESGVYYNFLKRNENGVKAKEGDFIKLLLSYRSSKHSLLFDSKL